MGRPPPKGVFMKIVRQSFVFVSLAVLLTLTAAPAGATHAWSTYHWAHTSNPFTLNLGDNVTSQWDAYLSEASADWTNSSVLNTTIVAGSVKNVKQCTPQNGRIEVCNSKYGNNGWLGIAGIYLTGGHIFKAYTKVNDSYFNTATYNKPEWRRLVMCQEIAHDFGLDHQDETFNNTNLGSCMDYTNNPLGPPSNEHPNAHDYAQLESIYSHTDSTTTAGMSASSKGNSSSRSRVVDVDEHGNGTITWILWID